MQNVAATVIDTCKFYSCNLCTIEPKNKKAYNLKDVHYCENGFIGFGIIDEDENRGKCVTFTTDEITKVRNASFTTISASSTAYVKNNRLENNLLLSVQWGYYFRNIPVKGKSIINRKIHPSYSINIKHGLLINFENENTYSSFLGVDMALNAYIPQLNGFINYSAGYTILNTSNQNRLYHSLGFNYLLI